MIRHKICGGEVKKRVCTKCGKSFSMLDWIVLKGLEEIDPDTRFNPEEYKKRIRSGRDIR